MLATWNKMVFCTLLFVCCHAGFRNVYVYFSEGMQWNGTSNGVWIKTLPRISEVWSIWAKMRHWKRVVSAGISRLRWTSYPLVLYLFGVNSNIHYKCATDIEISRLLQRLSGFIGRTPFGTVNPQLYAQGIDKFTHSLYVFLFIYFFYHTTIRLTSFARPATKITNAYGTEKGFPGAPFRLTLTIMLGKGQCDRGIASMFIDLFHLIVPCRLCYLNLNNSAPRNLLICQVLVPLPQLLSWTWKRCL